MPFAHATRLLAGVDYPKDLADFGRFFSDEQACERFLERLRWPKEFVCPACGHAGAAWRLARDLLCPTCQSRASVTAGAIFEGTRKPLTLWFIAAWEITGPHVRSQRVERAAHARRARLQDRLGVAPQVPSCDGPSRP